MNNSPNNPARFVTCPCQHCNGQIEFDASGFEKGETCNIECPHCRLETVIFVPVSRKPLSVPPPVPQPMARLQPVKKPKTFSEIVAILCLIGFFGWTALCGFGVLLGLVATGQSEAVNPVLTSNDQTSRAFGTIGFVIGMGMWFGIWLFGALPTFMIWMMTRKR
jgi:hypothetical protein